MEHLLVLAEDELTINPHFLSIQVIYDIWKRDPGSSQMSNSTGKKERVKHTARRELGWIWLMEDWRSPYTRYTILENKMAVIKKRVGLAEDWVEDNALKKAREWYAEEQVETNPLMFNLLAAKQSFVEIGEFLHSMKLTGETNRDSRGGARFKPKDITSAIKELAEAQEAIKVLEAQVKAAKSITSKVRGGGERGRYEDPKK